TAGPFRAVRGDGEDLDCRIGAEDRGDVVDTDRACRRGGACAGYRDAAGHRRPGSRALFAGLLDTQRRLAGVAARNAHLSAIPVVGEVRLVRYGLHLRAVADEIAIVVGDDRYHAEEHPGAGHQVDAGMVALELAAADRAAGPWRARHEVGRRRHAGRILVDDGQRTAVEVGAVVEHADVEHADAVGATGNSARVLGDTQVRL